MGTMIDVSFEDMDRDPVAPDDPYVMEMMYKSGTKPGEDGGTPEEKAAKLRITPSVRAVCRMKHCETRFDSRWLIKSCP